MLKKIIVTTDGTEPAKRAVEGAKSLQACFDCEVILYSIVESLSTSFASRVYTDSDSKFMKDSRESHKELFEKLYERLETIKDTFPNPDKVEVRTDVGPIGETIVKHATKENCDCIVVGSRDIGSVKKVFRGSVSDYVASHAKCSVYVVRNI